MDELVDCIEEVCIHLSSDCLIDIWMVNISNNKFSKRYSTVSKSNWNLELCGVWHSPDECVVFFADK